MNIMTNNVFIRESAAADGDDLCGLKHVGIKVLFSKATKLKLKSTCLLKDEDVLLTFVEDLHLVCWCPFHVFCFFVDHCHPKATKLHPRLVKGGGDEEKKLKKEFGKDMQCSEGGRGSDWNMGPTKHRDLCQQIPKLVGIARWEDYVGHALCALCNGLCICAGLSAADVAAKVCHASVNSQTLHA